MPAVPSTRKHIHRSPIGLAPGRSRRPTTSTQAALLQAMKDISPPIFSPNPSAILPISPSLDPVHEVSSSLNTHQKSRQQVEVGLPVNEIRASGEVDDGDIAGKGSGTGETSSMKLKREFHAVLAEAEKARALNKPGGGESTASSISWRAKRSNRRAMVAERAEKLRKGSVPGDKVLRGKVTGVTKNKRATRKRKQPSFQNAGKSELDDANILDSSISPTGGSTDASTRSPSPGSRDVSTHDTSENSPEDKAGGGKAETQKEMSAMEVVRKLGRHLGIFVTGVQDCTKDLRNSGEYRAWRDFLGKL